MNNYQRIAAGLMMSLGLAATADARISTKTLTDSCKQETLSRYSADNDKARVKFKGINGPSNARQVKVLVMQKGAENYRASCRFNAHTGEVLSVDKSY